MTLQESKDKFTDLMRGLKSETDKIEFLQWIYKNWDLENLVKDDDSHKELLNSIAEKLRSMLPLKATLSSENINLPDHGPNSDCESKTTVHVDEFLYNDDDICELVDKGQLSRYYCRKCFSKDVKLLTFISHSMSVNRINYLFRNLLQPLKNETILDVGSRLGPVLYGAYIYTSCPRIIGVEINSEFCKFQSSIVNQYKFGDRIQIICNNIFNELDVLSSADVIVLNNVFEFFADFDTTITSWHLLAQNIKVGCMLVTIPPLNETFQHFRVDFNWRDWAEELEAYQPFYNRDDDFENHEKFIRRYRIKKRFGEFKR